MPLVAEAAVAWPVGDRSNGDEKNMMVEAATGSNL